MKIKCPICGKIVEINTDILSTPFPISNSHLPEEKRQIEELPKEKRQIEKQPIIQPSLEKPTISEILSDLPKLKQMLGEKFQDGDLLDLLETYNLTRKEAEEVMNLLYEYEIIARDPEGYLRWLK
jgi:hypothetical protein